MTYSIYNFFSLQVNKTIKSNREILNDFFVLFEYIKLKIGIEGEKRQNKKEGKKKELIKLSSNSNNKQETNCSSLQMAIVIINEVRRKTKAVQ